MVFHNNRQILKDTNSSSVGGPSGKVSVGPMKKRKREQHDETGPSRDQLCSKSSSKSPQPEVSLRPRMTTRKTAAAATTTTNTNTTTTIVKTLKNVADKPATSSLSATCSRPTTRASRRKMKDEGGYSGLNMSIEDKEISLSCEEVPCFDTPTESKKRCVGSSSCSASSWADSDCSALTTSLVPVPPGIIDIDDMEGLLSRDVGPQRFNAYSREYHTYLREKERSGRDRPSVDYLEKVQKEVTKDMRALLVDWLITVTMECELMPSTLYHCVELIDRSLSLFQVRKDKLQCLGCACLLIACKFEETTAPCLSEFIYMAADSFTKQDLTNLELQVVEALQFRVSAITVYNFLPRFVLAAGSMQKEKALVHYLAELMLLDYGFLSFEPSVLAASALYLARKTLHPAASPSCIWTPTIEYYTGYGIQDLEKCVRLLHQSHVAAEWSSYEAAREKYATSEALHVSEISPLDEKQLVF